MRGELSTFELDRELARVAPRARAAYRALRSGKQVTLNLPEVLGHPETIARLTSDIERDPLAAPLLRQLYWLELMRRALPREGARIRCYRGEHHTLDHPLSGHFTWRELLGHALRDRARRAALLETLLERGDTLRDAGARLYEVRAELPSFGGKSRAELELPCPQIVECAVSFLARSADAYGSLGAHDLAQLIELGLAARAADGWPRGLSPRSLAELLGSHDWLSGLRPELGDLPAPISAASFVRGLLRLGAAWCEALAPTNQPYSVARDPFGLSRARAGAQMASLAFEPAFLRRQLGLGRERAASHARALGASALIFTRLLALRVLQADAALAGPRALQSAFSEHVAITLGFELPEAAFGLLFRPRLGDAQRFAGMLLAASRVAELTEDHDEDWFRNPRAIEQLREAERVPPDVTCAPAALDAGAATLVARLAALL